MPLQFARARPLQAGKLAVVLVALLFSAGVYLGVVPLQSVTGLFVVPVLALVLAVAVAVEALSAGYRRVRDGGPLTERLADRPAYALVHGGEVAVAVLAVGAFAAVLAALPDGPMAGPGAVGLFFLMVGLGLLILGASLVRTLTEYYYYRRGSAA
jgi:hypothetical protein